MYFFLQKAGIINPDTIIFNNNNLINDYCLVQSVVSSFTSLVINFAYYSWGLAKNGLSETLSSVLKIYMREYVRCCIFYFAS